MGKDSGKSLGWLLLAGFRLIGHYHRYTYSLVLAADMYKTVFEDDPLDPRRGKRYREKILLPGGSRDEMDTLVVSP